MHGCYCVLFVEYLGDFISDDGSEHKNLDLGWITGDCSWFTGDRKIGFYLGLTMALFGLANLLLVLTFLWLLSNNY